MPFLTDGFFAVYINLIEKVSSLNKGGEDVKSKVNCNQWFESYYWRKKEPVFLGKKSKKVFTKAFFDGILYINEI